MSDTSFKREVLLPFILSLLFGFLMGIFALIILQSAGNDSYFNYSLAVWIGTASVLFWSLAIREANKSKPKPKQKKHTDTIRINMLDETSPYTKGWYIDLEVQETKLILLSREITVENKSFTMASFGGRGKLFSRREFEMLRDNLIRGRILTWRNPDAHTQGVDVTYPGRAFFRYYAQRETHSTHLILQNYERYVRDTVQFRRARKRTKRRSDASL